MYTQSPSVFHLFDLRTALKGDYFDCSEEGWSLGDGGKHKAIQYAVSSRLNNVFKICDVILQHRITQVVMTIL